MLFYFFFFNDTATTEIYTLSLHDALPIYLRDVTGVSGRGKFVCNGINLIVFTRALENDQIDAIARSEEHTSELQSRRDLVCRLLLEKKKKKNNITFKEPNIKYIPHLRLSL